MTPNMLILIFKHKNYVSNRFTELIPHEIALWYCKMEILEVYWKPLTSPFVLYERCGFVNDYKSRILNTGTIL